MFITFMYVLEINVQVNFKITGLSLYQIHLVLQLKMFPWPNCVLIFNGIKGVNSFLTWFLNNLACSVCPFTIQKLCSTDSS